jgi:thiol-disulfide isomerase/thioredoxin
MRGWVFPLLLLSAAAPRPVVGEDGVRPVERPYDTRADAHAAVAAALAAARASGRDVLMEFGGNWCADCRVLTGVLEAPAVKPWVDANFVVVLVDIGRLTKNLDIAARYGVKVEAAPAVVVVSPQGRLVNRGAAMALGDAGDMDPQKIVDLLAGWRTAGR